MVKRIATDEISSRVEKRYKDIVLEWLGSGDRLIL